MPHEIHKCVRMNLQWNAFTNAPKNDFQYEKSIVFGSELNNGNLFFNYFFFFSQRRHESDEWKVHFLIKWRSKLMWRVLSIDWQQPNIQQQKLLKPFGCEQITTIFMALWLVQWMKITESESNVAIRSCYMIQHHLNPIYALYNIQNALFQSLLRLFILLLSFQYFLHLIDKIVVFCWMFCVYVCVAQYSNI